MTDLPTLRNLLEQVNSAAPDQQWGVIRDVARDLLEVGDPVRAHVNQLCDAGGYESAALALVERVLPGWIVRMDISNGTQASVEPSWKSLDEPRSKSFWEGTAPTPALALLSAMLSALSAKEL